MRLTAPAVLAVGCALGSVGVSAAAQDRYVIAGSALHAEALREVLAQGAVSLGTNHRGDALVQLSPAQAASLALRVRSLARTKGLRTELVRVPVVQTQNVPGAGGSTSRDAYEFWLTNTRLRQGQALGSRALAVGTIDTGNTATPGAQELPGFDFASTNLGETRITRGQLAENGRDAEPADIGDALSEDSGTSSWHGTSVASVIAGEQSAERNLYSVNPGGEIVFARALWVVKDPNPQSPSFGQTMRGGHWDDIVAAAKWLAGVPVPGVAMLNPNPVRVINMSFASKDACHPYWAQDFVDLRARGVVVVAAAGNGREKTEDYFPGNCPGVITVGAVTEDGSLAEYSNFGPGTTVFAPGGGGGSGVMAWTNTGLRLPNYGDGASVPQGVRGTSFSAPFVSGVVALMLAANPTISAEAVRAVLAHTARPLPALRSDAGAGLIDVEAAVKAARDGAISVPSKVSIEAARAPVTVANTQRAMVQLTAAYFTGEAPAEFTVDLQACMQPVNAGQVCEVHVQRLRGSAAIATLNLQFSDGRTAQTDIIALPSTQVPVVAPAPPTTSDAPVLAAGGGGGTLTPSALLLLLLAGVTRARRAAR